MKHSIKTKLFLLFAGVLAAFLLAGVVFSSLFMKQYYINENKPILTAAAAKVEDVLDGSKEQIQVQIDDIDHNDAISITIASSDKILEYTSYPRKVSDSSKMPQELSDLISNGNSTAFGKVTSSSGSERIAYAMQAGTGEWIIASKQLNGIKESAAIAERFFLLFACAAMILGGVVIYWFSGRIVRPVMELNEAAKQISNLQFERIQDIKSQDEIGELAKNMNVISEKLEKSIDSLKKDVIYQKRLTRDTSHELKTPIGVIKGYAEGLLYGVADTPESIKEYCETIVAECDRMDVLVKELLELSALEAADAKANKRQLHAGEVIQAVVDSYKPLLQENQIKLDIQCSPEMMVNADEAMLKRALGNFLTNAVRYCDDKKEIRITVQSEDCNTTFTVFNSGNGISETELPHIWDTFYKVDQSRTRNESGHGLGLAIVKSIVQLHQGTYGAKNCSDGIEFYITI